MQNRESQSENKFRAMVLAAGVGSRLDPLSSAVPKPLVRIGGRPVMEHILLSLKKYGVKEVISNTHHLAEQIHDYFADAKERLSIDLRFVHEDKLSGVAGGIRKCKDFLKQGTACIVMGDALTDIDLGMLYEKHKEAVQKHGCLVTVAQMQVSDTSQFGVIVTKSEGDEKGRIINFQEKPKAEDALSNWANTGIYFFEPEVYNFIPSEEEAPFYDVAKDLFPKLLEEEKYMQAIEVQENAYWADIGTPKQYLQSMNDIYEGKVKIDFLPAIDKSSKIASDIKMVGKVEIGPNCNISESVLLDNCILWSDIHIAKGAKLKNCIIADACKIDENSDLEGQILVASSCVNT